MTVRPEPAAPEDAPLPLQDPAMLLAILVAAACVMASLAANLADTTFWHHLAVGRAVWEQGRAPTVHQWSWPLHGAPGFEPAWGFGALLWPVWSWAGVFGLFAWRWAAALLALGLLWAAARRLGARGFTPLVVAVVASLALREPSGIGPESMGWVLLALQIWILETRRNGGPDRSPWLVPIAGAWINVHPGWPLGFVVLGAYLLRDLLSRWLGRPHGFSAPLEPGGRRLWLSAALAALVSFANPFGWRAVWEPFHWILERRQEPIARLIPDLAPLDWAAVWRSGTPLLLVGWPALLLWRWWRRGPDVAEIALCAAFTWLALAAQRFAPFHALAAVPFVARDAAELLRSLPLPAAVRAAAPRAAIAAALCVAAGWLEWSRADRPLGIAIDSRQIPARAADWLAGHEVRGRGFAHHHLAGYLAFRFWPDRERLPFMDVHATGHRVDRVRYARAFTVPDGWPVLDHSHRFDWALLDANQPRGGGDWLRDRLDADSAWSLVFLDDAAALYLRRSGRHAELARRNEYYAIPAGEARLQILGPGTERDSMLRQLARFELERQIRESPLNARAHSMLANLDIQSGDLAAARRRLESALRQDPLTFAAHERLGMIAMAAGRAREAREAFERERRLTGGTPQLPQRLEQARTVARTAPGAR